LLWVVPGLTKPGVECQQAVDLMSIYPTVCELTGIPIPKHAEGISIKPLLKDPKAEWTQPALSTMYRSNHSLRTADWRYIHYADGSEELYNEKQDPREWTNVATKPEFANIKANLAKYLPATNATSVEPTITPAKEKKQQRKKKNAAAAATEAQ
jgi:arylsulfatase A-like enzyme